MLRFTSVVRAAQAAAPVVTIKAPGLGPAESRLAAIRLYKDVSVRSLYSWSKLYSAQASYRQSMSSRAKPWHVELHFPDFAFVTIWLARFRRDTLECPSSQLFQVSSQLIIQLHRLGRD